MSGINIHTASLRRTLRAGEACGIDPVEVCQTAGIPQPVTQSILCPPDQLPLPSVVNQSHVLKRVPFGYHDSLWSCLSYRLTDMKLCLATITNFPAEGFGPIAFAAMTAPTLYEGIRQVLGHYLVLTNTGYWEERAAADEVTFIWHRKVKSSTEHSANIANILGVGKGAATAAGPYAPVIDCYNFKSDKPTQGPDLADELGVAVRFNAAEDSFTIRREKLDIIPPLANSPMNAFFVAMLRKEIAELPLDGDIVVQLRDLLAQRQDFSDLTLDMLSDELKVSPRTLHRRLAAMNTSFSAELDDARKTRALKLVTTSNESMLNIAYALGFSSPGAFTRAFKRWYQATPMQLRQKVTA